MELSAEDCKGVISTCPAFSRGLSLDLASSVSLHCHCSGSSAHLQPRLDCELTV